MEKPKLDFLSSYIAMIESSVGANLFRHRYYHIGGQSLDVLEDGDLSCAMYVSSILYLSKLIGNLHTTVNGTIEDIEASGWFKISEPRKGAIMLWGFKKKDDGTQGKHRHVGFYIDPESAISNDSTTRVVARHHPTYGTFENGESCRDIQAFYWHSDLDS